MNRDKAWGADEFDLAKYLHRIGLTEPVTVDRVGLTRLVQAHATTLPWENLDGVRGIAAELTIDALQHRMIDGRRGLGCSGHVPLLAAALQRLGFTFSVVYASVLVGEMPTAASHAAIVAEAEGELWLLEVGFGAVPLAPVRLVSGEEQLAGGWRYRVISERIGFTEQWLLEFFDPSRGEWRPQYRFPLADHIWQDLQMTNYFVATSPYSSFRGRIMVVANHIGERQVLTGDTVTVTRPDGFRESRPYDPADRVAILAEQFAVDLPERDAREVQAVLDAATSAS